MKEPHGCWKLLVVFFGALGGVYFGAWQKSAAAGMWMAIALLTPFVLLTGFWEVWKKDSEG